MQQLPFQDEWSEGMRNEDGIQLMECLMKEPGLVSVTYRGCNVLHLAVRHNWYGLVLEILDRRKFNIPNDDAEGSALSEEGPVDTGPRSRMEDIISKVDTEGSASAKGVSVCPKGSGSMSGNGDGIPVDVEGFAEGVFPGCSEGAGPEPWNEDGNTSQALDLTTVTISLLTAREGNGAISDTTDVYYSSGLDVLAMAEIQCHHAINSALSSFLWDVRLLLGKDHPYRFYSTPSDKKKPEAWPVPSGPDDEKKKPKPWPVPSGPDDKFKESAKEALRRYVREYFPDPSLEEWIILDEAPNCTSRTGTMSDTSPKGSRSSEFHSHPLIVRQWMVTAPFLSLSEYLFLEGSRTWGFSNLQVGLRQDKDCILMLGSIISDPLIGQSSMDPDLPQEFGVSFFKYLMDITDTRRMAFHYGLISGICLQSSVNSEDVTSPILKLFVFLVQSKRRGDQSGAKDKILKEFEARFSMLDGAGRSLVHTLLASDLDLKWPGFELHVFSELCWSLNLGHLRECPDGHWYFSGKSWRTNVSCIYAAHGLPGWDFEWKMRDFPLSADMTVLTSPHLSPWQRTERLRWLLERDTFVSTVALPRVRLQNGGVSEEWLITSLKYAVLLDDTVAVELLAQDKRVHDPARMDNLSTFEESMSFNEELALHTFGSSLFLAAAQGDLEMIRILLNTRKFDYHYINEDGQTMLHHAVCSQEEPLSVPVMLHDFVEIPRMPLNLHFHLSKPEATDDHTIEHVDKRSGQ